MKRAASLLTALLLLTGCAGPSTTKTSSAEAPSASASESGAETTDFEVQEEAPWRWNACDSEAQQPHTQIFDRELRVYTPSCATDRTKATPALEPVDLATSAPQMCMLEETSLSRERYGDYIIGGFPRALVDGNLPSEVELTMVVVAMDWPDLKSAKSAKEQIEPAVAFTDNFYRVFSRGKVTFNWRIYDEWIRAPDESSNYYVSQEEMQDEHGAMRDMAEIYFPKVIEFTDPFVDYSDADLVLYVWPEEQDLFTQYIMWDREDLGLGPFMSDEGLISQALTGGKFHFEDGRGGLGPFWVHEMGHAFGLPDLNWNELDGLRNDGNYLPGSFNGYDLMAGFDATRTMTSWLMFLADWLGETELYCADPTDFQGGSFELYPVTDESDTLKSIMLPVNERFQIVIESRRISQFDVADASKTRSREGVLVYLVDSTKGQGEGTQVLIAPPGRGLYVYAIETSFATDQLDAMFYEGNTVDIAGYRITVNEFTPERDLVSVSRISEAEIQHGNYVCITEENRDRSRKYDEYCPLEEVLPTS